MSRRPPPRPRSMALRHLASRRTRRSREVTPMARALRSVAAVLGRGLRGLAAFVVLAALLGGVPWALATFVGWPLPRQWPGWHDLAAAFTTTPLSDGRILDVLAVIGWVLWLLFVRDVAVE